MTEKTARVLMLLENACYPIDLRVQREALSLTAAGHSVAVICKRRRGQPFCEVLDGVRVYRYPAAFWGGGFVAHVWEYTYSLAMAAILSLWVLLRHGFDVIHAHNPPDLYVLLAAPYKLLGKKFVFDHHDLMPEMYRAMSRGRGRRLVYRALIFFERLTCRLADHVIAPNESHRRVEIERGGVKAERISVVRNSPREILLEDAPPDPRLAALDKTILLYVGIIGFQDGVEYLIDALRVLRDELGRGDFHCVVVGSGDARASLQKQVAEWDLDSQCEFPGFVSGDPLRRLFAAADICVAPEPSNRYNDQSTVIKLMEYMAVAKPAVAFDLPEHRVTAGDTAEFVRANDMRAFAESIAALMDDPSRRRKLGQRARQRLVDRLLWNRQEEKLLAAYQQLLATTTATRHPSFSQDAV